MNNLLWSILANRLGNSEDWDVAKAYILNMVPTGDRTQAGTDMENFKATIVTFASDPPEDRAASWYQNDAPFRDSLGDQSLGPLPSIAGEDSKVLANANGALVWATGGGGSLTGVGAFDTTPNTKGLSVTAGDVSLSEADDTNPGGLSAAAQDIGGLKTFVDDIVSSAVTAQAGDSVVITGTQVDGATAVGVIVNTEPINVASGCKWFSVRTHNSEQYFWGVVGGINTFSCPGRIQVGSVEITNGISGVLQTVADSPLYLYGKKANGASAENIILDTQATYSTGGAAVAVFKNNGAKVAAVETNGTVFGIYLKSPDGTAYLVTVANGGTINVAAAP